MKLMATLYILYGVPGSGKKDFLSNLSEGMFASEFKNIIEEHTFEKEREIIEYILNEGEDAIIDINNAMPSVFESWFDFIYNLGHKIKIIIMSTPFDKIKENTELDEGHIQSLYNNFVNTIGWLYLNYKSIIINSANLL